MKITISVAQMDVSFGKPAENFARLNRLLPKLQLNKPISWFFQRCGTRGMI